jgi:hypothetical protein
LERFERIAFGRSRELDRALAMEANEFVLGSRSSQADGTELIEFAASLVKLLAQVSKGALVAKIQFGEIASRLAQGGCEAGDIGRRIQDAPTHGRASSRRGAGR